MGVVDARGDRLHRIRRRTFLAGASVAFLSACAGDPQTSPLAGASGSPLRSPWLGTATLDDVLARRRSVRAFSGARLDEDLISHLLWAAQGVTAADRGGRTAPSAGATYPIELYLATAAGVRRYLPAAHRAVEVTREDRRPEIAAATGGQGAALGAPASFVITAVVDRTAGKYGDRAERYVQLEAGHACQNLLLEAVALGLGAVPIGAFSDDDLRRAIDAADDETPLYVVPVGHVE